MATKRKLTLRWSKREGDFVFDWPARPGAKGSARLICHTICDADPSAILEGRSLIEELERRGYDPKTVRFEIAVAGEVNP